MEIVKSHKFTSEEASVVDRAVSAVFNAHNQPQDTYFPNVSLFISSDTNEHPDYVININSLLGDARLQMVELLRLSNFIFRGAYIEPRYILAEYEQPQAKIEVPVIVTEDIIIEAPEEKAEELKHEEIIPEENSFSQNKAEDTEEPVKAYSTPILGAWHKVS